MATKRGDASIADLIKTDMAARNIGGTKEVPETHANPLQGVQQRHEGGAAEAQETPVSTAAPPRKVKQKESVKIRLDAGDYKTLQEIADESGTKASILIRQAVKQIIKAHKGQ
ncbi:hypothetical protein Barb4_03450 [Bacteroidales bacterium Barb4]|nr:hypothetical protein Barb4_03450 [Bacteroidales bacterium Barb4]